MKSWKSAMLVIGWTLLAGIPALAQVEWAVIETKGMKAGCAASVESGLKSMTAVHEYRISVDDQMFSVTYYAGEKFDPVPLRWAAHKGEAEVLRITISATGKVQQEGDLQVFVVGQDRFVIKDPRELPKGVAIGIAGVVDDSTTPIGLTPSEFQVLGDRQPSKTP